MLRHTGLQLPTPRLTPAQQQDLVETFEIFDKNHDGAISTQELASVFKMMNIQMSRDELQSLMQEHDFDRNGTLSFDEFAVLMASTFDASDPLEELRDAFAVFDRDGNGRISPQELKMVMKSLGDGMSDQEIKELIAEVDGDGDGMVNWREFVDMMTQGIDAMHRGPAAGEKPKKKRFRFKFKWKRRNKDKRST